VKGRLFIPSQFREQLEKACEKDRVIIRKNDSGNFLDVYPLSVWAEEVAFIESKLNLLNPEHYDIYRQHTEEATIIDIDKPGRILIPKQIANELCIESDVVITGTTKKITIWSRQKYEEDKKANAAKRKEQKIALFSKE
jgi:MraZ protein